MPKEQVIPKFYPLIGEIIQFYPSDIYEKGEFTSESHDAVIRYNMKFMGWARAVSDVSDDETHYNTELVPAFLEEGEEYSYGHIVTLDKMRMERPGFIRLELLS